MNESNIEASIASFLNKKRLHRTLKSITINEYVSIIKNMHELINSEQVTKDLIEEYLFKLKDDEDRKLKDSTINKYFSVIKDYVNFLKEIANDKLLLQLRYNNAEQIRELTYWIANYDAILNMKNIKYKFDKKPFTFEEVEYILNCARDNICLKGLEPRLAHLILKFIAVGTGARNTACRKLEIQDCDFATCNWDCESCIPTVMLLRKGKIPPKIDVQCKKSVCKEMKQYVNYYQPYKYVFEKDGTYLSKQQLNRLLNNIIEQTDLEKMGRSIHALRKFYSSELARRETPLSHIARQLDHERKIEGVVLGITFEHYIKFGSAKELKLNYPDL